MQTYYFHIYDRGNRITDVVGVGLPDDATALEEGRKAARDMLIDATIKGDDVLHRMIEIVADGGRAVGSVSIAHVILSADRDPTP